MKMTRIITYNGKSVKTKYHSALEWHEFHELRAQYYAKPSIEQVQLEILKFHQGGIKTTLITNYYFKALMSKVILYHSKFSIQEVFMCKELGLGLGLVLVEEIVLDIGKRLQHSEEKITVFKKQKGGNKNE